MDYRQKIKEIIIQIEDEKILRRIYLIILTIVQGRQ